MLFTFRVVLNNPSLSFNFRWRISISQEDKALLIDYYKRWLLVDVYMAVMSFNSSCNRMSIDLAPILMKKDVHDP